MTSRIFRWIARALVTASLVAGHAPLVRAQTVEITPFAGYRFGGDFFELAVPGPVDRDGAPSAGVLLDVPLHDGLSFEALVTHQSAGFAIPAVGFGPPVHEHVVVQHFLGGGLQEFGFGRVRPFLTGTVGLSRYAVPGDSEIRVALAAGGGVKLYPWKMVGVRLDSRFYATFVDLDSHATVCAPGRCFFALDAAIVWQAEFIAGLVFRFR